MRARFLSNRSARMRKGLLASALLSLVLFLAAPGTALACPSCSETLNDGQKPNALARGFAWNIGAMLLVPMALVGGGVLLVARARRMTDLHQKSDGELHAPER